MRLKTSLLLITYNRPDLTDTQIQECLKDPSRKIYVFSDGPKQSNDKLVLENQKVITYYQSLHSDRITIKLANTNFGCGKAVKTAIDWAFKNEDQLIILEDDCNVSSHFLEFSDYALEKYCNDQEIFGISAENKLAYNGKPASTYYSIDFPLIWGWATWSRAWKLYEDDAHKCLTKMGHVETRPDLTSQNKKYLSHNLQKVASGTIDTWDYQLLHSVQSHDMKFLVPSTNLVKNTGFRHDATHTKRGRAPDMRLGSMNVPFSYSDDQSYNEYLKSFFKKRNWLQKIWWKLYGH